MRLRLIDDNRKKIIFNYFSLMSLQGVNYILPLLLMPFLLDRLGLDNFGLLTYITTVFLIYGFFLDYGFNLSAAREISENLDNKKKISEIFLSVYTIKFFIIIIFIVLLMLSFGIDIFEKKDEKLIIYFFISTNLQFMLPTFLLIGIERMGALSIMNMLIKVLSTILIFLFVKDDEYINLVPIMYSIGGIIALIYSAFYIYNLQVIDFKASVNKSTIISSLVKGFPIFIAILSSNIIYYSPILVLGYIESKLAVGIYTVADTIMRAIRNIIYPAASAILPYSTKIAKLRINSSLAFNLKVAIFFSILLSLLCLCFYFFSTSVIDFFVKDNASSVNEIRSYFNILLLFVPLHPIIHIFATQSVLNMNLTKIYAFIFLAVALLSILCNYIFIEQLSIKGATFSYGIIEIILCISLISCIIYFLKYRKVCS